MSIYELLDADSNWITLDSLIGIYGVTEDTVIDWINTKADMTKYESIVSYSKSGTSHFIHIDSWKKFCDDFWFRNIDMQTL